MHSYLVEYACNALRVSTSVPFIPFVWIPEELVLADEACNFIPITKLAANDGLQNACSLFRERSNYVLMSVESKSDTHFPHACRIADQDSRTLCYYYRGFALLTLQGKAMVMVAMLVLGIWRLALQYSCHHQGLPWYDTTCIANYPPYRRGTRADSVQAPASSTVHWWRDGWEAEGSLQPGGREGERWKTQLLAEEEIKTQSNKIVSFSEVIFLHNLSLQIDCESPAISTSPTAWGCSKRWLHQPLG